jgi:hypothetical protein
LEGLETVNAALLGQDSHDWPRLADGLVAPDLTGDGGCGAHPLPLVARLVDREPPGARTRLV